MSEATAGGAGQGELGLVPAAMRATASAIAAAQLPGGAIPWPDGHVDPWDHVECAMALSACGLTRPARLAYQWLRETQRADGSWPRSFGAAPVPPGNQPAAGTAGQLVATDQAAESHHVAYVAVGVWHELLVTGDLGFAMSMWPVVRRAIDWVVELQAPRGEIAWERDAAGAAGGFALLSGCASSLQGLRCAIALAEMAGQPQPDWELAADQLAHVVACHPEAFADKSRWAMDWYYPVLGGALRGAAAAEHLAASWDTFVVRGLGVRCVSDQPWVTVAETCELVLSLEACGRRPDALELLQSVQSQRHSDGSYWTGWQFVNGKHFPNERSSWTAAAVILATDALHGFSRGAGIFRDVPSASSAVTSSGVTSSGATTSAATSNAATSSAATDNGGTRDAFAHGADIADDQWFAAGPYPSADPAACGCFPAPASRSR